MLMLVKQRMELFKENITNYHAKLFLMDYIKVKTKNKAIHSMFWHTTKILTQIESIILLDEMFLFSKRQLILNIAAQCQT